jgi:hypothetical protein
VLRSDALEQRGCLSCCEQVFGCPETAQTDAFDQESTSSSVGGHRTRDMSRRAEAWARERCGAAEASVES